jgi:hypothetical protein
MARARAATKGFSRLVRLRQWPLGFVLVALTATLASAQDESRFHADLRREGDDIKRDCGSGFGVKQVFGCAVTLATDEPFHVALGSLAPLNGMGFGAAFVEHYTPNENWRLSWNADTVVATSGSWRAGAYMKIIHIPSRGISVVRPGGAEPPPSVPITEYPVFNVYVQSSTLDSLVVTAGQTPFSEHQTIVGTNVLYPLTRIAGIRVLRPSLVGAVNGRFLNVESQEPGLSQSPGFAQFEEGVRVKPSVFADRLQLNYLLDFQQFVTSASSKASFNRWTVDLSHTFPLYSTATSTGPREFNGPDECRESVGSPGCPPITYSSNRQGTIGFRLLASESTAGGDDTVPFYFQPTLGGSDINGQRLLAGYDDYKFRGPNLLALQESIEHSLWGPVGVYFLAEQGKVTQQNEGLGDGALQHSFAVGFTLRAGGFPLVNLTFAWGTDSHHIIGSIDQSLLGGSSRPSLY